VNYSIEDALSLPKMRALTAQAIEKYGISTDIMVENGGLQLARLLTEKASREAVIVFGIGPGENGSCGLVAARRLAAWGYQVLLDVSDPFLSKLTQLQLKRALASGAQKMTSSKSPDIFVDAWLGLDQSLPLAKIYTTPITYYNQSPCIKIALDVPTGLTENEDMRTPYLQADIVCTLGIPKKVLFNPLLTAQVFVADIGIPNAAYQDLDIFFDVPFEKQGFVQLFL